MGGTGLDTVVKKLYEGLFLVDSGDAAADWSGVCGGIEKLLKKSGAEVTSLRKWDERRLAYEIKGKSRGTYILAYFNSDPSKIGLIERDVQLSERIIRVLIVRTDKMSTSDIGKETPAMAVENRDKPESPAEVVAGSDSKAKEPVPDEAEVGVAAEVSTKETGEAVESDLAESDVESKSDEEQGGAGN